MAAAISGGMRLQREMSGVEEAHRRVRDVALERLGARRQEEWIVLAPRRQQRRLVGAEIVAGRSDRARRCSYSRRTGRAARRRRRAGRDRNCRASSRPARPCVGSGHAMRILPDGRLRLEEGAQRLTVCGRSVLPIGPDRIPAVAQALLISVAVLRDDRGDPIRMLDREPEPGRRAIVERIDGVAVEADGLGEAVDRLCNPGERVPLIAAYRSCRIQADRARRYGSGRRAAG